MQTNIKQRPNGYWYLYVKAPGQRPVWKSTGTNDQAEALGQVEPKLSDLKVRFLAFLVESKKSPKIYTLARRAFDLFIEHLGDRRLSQLTKSDVQPRRKRGEL